ncbi:hypothetical protein NJ7G_3003 [Natrinema sp. J7-2]|nr:hypothetical protein NJ7G_3003 [Natrinema sp. J7-2]
MADLIETVAVEASLPTIPSDDSPTPVDGCKEMRVHIAGRSKSNGTNAGESRNHSTPRRRDRVRMVVAVGRTRRLPIDGCDGDRGRRRIRTLEAGSGDSVSERVLHSHRIAVGSTPRARSGLIASGPCRRNVAPSDGATSRFEY